MPAATSSWSGLEKRIREFERADSLQRTSAKQECKLFKLLAWTVEVVQYSRLFEEVCYIQDME